MLPVGVCRDRIFLKDFKRELNTRTGKSSASGSKRQLHKLQTATHPKAGSARERRRGKGRERRKRGKK